MLSQSEILIECQRLSKMAMEAEKLNPLNAYSKLFGDYYKEYREEMVPEYYPGYRAAVEDYEAIRVHADKNCFPARLFARRAPNQTDKAAEWIRENYKNVTQPVYLDFLNTVTRCSKDSYWAIDYGAESDIMVSSGMTFEEYVEKEIKSYGSIENFFKSIVFDIKLKDAMGVIAVKPRFIPTIETPDGPVISSTELIQPIPVYYTCKQVVQYKPDEYAYILLEEKSKVRYGNGIVEKGRIYEVYDDQNIYIVRQIGKYTENQFEIELYYNHAWDKLPVERLKGVPRVYEDKVFYQSQFLFAVDLLDLCTQNHAYLQASIAKCVFPATIMLGNVCDFEDENYHKCDNGYLRWYDTNNVYQQKRCPNCHGIGLTPRLGPLETILIKPPVRGVTDGDDATANHKPLEYVSPDITTLEFLEAHIEAQETKARKILHLKESTTNIKGNEDLTATGQMIDREATEAFIMPIAYQAFELLEFVYNAIGWMRYKNDFTPPKITYPQGMEIGTAQDILYTISEMVKANVPEIVIQGEVYRFIKSMYYTEKIASQVYRLINEADRIMIMSSDDVALRTAKGLIADWESILHDSSIGFINELLLEDEKFFEKDIKDQKEALTSKAKAKAEDLRKAKEIKTPGVETLIKEVI